MTSGELTQPSPSSDAPLIAVKELAVMLQIAERTVWRLNSAKKLPKPIRLGRSVRWRRSDIEAWLQAGCPKNSNEP